MAVDQFGNSMTNQPSFTWSKSSGGDSNITSGGLYTAPSNGNDATYTVTASASGKSGSANIAVKCGGVSDDPIDPPDSGSVAPNDDSYSPLLDIGMRLNFCGTAFDQVYVNNNGNITVSSGLSTYTPSSALTSAYGLIIAPFFADVDTRPNLGTVTYGPTTIGGHTAWEVDWNNVGYFNQHGDKRNTFSLILVDRSDVFEGDFDIIFNYGSITWETGDASNGQNGFGGTPARAGYSNGSGTTGTYYELSGSGVVGGLLGKTGQYTYEIRNKPVLLELTVGDSNHLGNFTTAIDAAVRELYVDQDQTTHTAEVDVNTLFAPMTFGANGVGRNIHVTITRNDNAVFADQYLYNDNTLSYRSLGVTRQAHDFVIKAWFDENHNGQVDGGEDKREVHVNVIMPTYQYVGYGGTTVAASAFCLDNGWGHPNIPFKCGVNGRFASQSNGSGFTSDVWMWGNAPGGICNTPVAPAPPDIGHQASGCFVLYVSNLPAGEYDVDIYYGVLATTTATSGGAEGSVSYWGQTYGSCGWVTSAFAALPGHSIDSMTDTVVAHIIVPTDFQSVLVAKYLLSNMDQPAGNPSSAATRAIGAMNVIGVRRASH
jgi:hypothetical protein